MDRPWFDRETGTLLLDEYVVEMDSYQRIVEDEAISDAELVEQTERVSSLLRQLEEALSPEAQAIATEALGELAVLNALQIKRLQDTSVTTSVKEVLAGGHGEDSGKAQAPTPKGGIRMGTFSSSHTYPYVVEDLVPVAQDVMRHFEQQEFEVTETTPSKREGCR